MKVRLLIAPLESSLPSCSSEFAIKKSSANSGV
jgi:hypothetical protein